MKLRNAIYYNETSATEIRNYRDLVGWGVMEAKKHLIDEVRVLEYSLDGGDTWVPVEEVKIPRSNTY